MNDHSLLPRISIVTPCLNQARFLEETIRSVLHQGYPNLEYIIIDGGSTDGSVAIIKEYESQLSYWVSEKDNGQVDAITKGMSKASGAIVNWLNADDYLCPDALMRIAEKWIEVGRKKCVLCGDGLFLDDASETFTSSKVRKTIEPILPTAPPYFGGVQASWFLTRDAWDAVGGLNASLNYTMDTDLYFRCHLESIPFYRVESEIAVYRKHSDTKTSKGWKQSISYKERFYYGLLSKVPLSQRKEFRSRVRRNIFGYYKQSISRDDSRLFRTYKLLLGLRHYPEALLQPHQLRHFYSLLLQ